MKWESVFGSNSDRTGLSIIFCIFLHVGQSYCYRSTFLKSFSLFTALNHKFLLFYNYICGFKAVEQEKIKKGKRL